MIISGWGGYPQSNSKSFTPSSASEVASICSESPLIVRGSGRSYGDSSLFETVLSTKRLNHILHFDEQNGILECQAGLTFRQLLQVIMPRGWIFPVMPGTSHVSIGGAIASDIHGKNHHLAGSFSEHLESIFVQIGTGERIEATRERYKDLFQATCGGMGLTGIILSAKIKLNKISSTNVHERRTKARDLFELFDLFDQYQECSYNVAWIDTQTRGHKLGRSILITGEHALTGSLNKPIAKQLIEVPFQAPSNLLNRHSITAFNNIYYSLATLGKSSSISHIGEFFFPLDRIGGWNKLYGTSGFIQYQFVVPTQGGLDAISKILKDVSATGAASFLSVLKKFGPENSNFLSFPLEGYTLAMDIPVSLEAFKLIKRLDRIVVEHGGKIYLCKDSTLDESTFKSIYPKWPDFQAVRFKYSAVGKFKSNQSIRLGLE